MRRGEDIYVGKRSAHAAGNRLIAFDAQQRIQPDQLAHAALDRSQFGSQHIRFARLPAIAQDDQERIAESSFVPCIWLKTASDSPILVPPDHPAACSASAGQTSLKLCARKALVMRTSCVLKRNVSTCQKYFCSV